MQREGSRKPTDSAEGHRRTGDDHPPADQSAQAPGTERRNPAFRDRDEGDGGGQHPILFFRAGWWWWWYDPLTRA